jgi:uncharacterized membrane protein HdeD (DUF308 family)
VSRGDLLLISVSLVGVAVTASGVVGLVARTKVPQPPGRGQAVAAAFRVVAGIFVLAYALAAGNL